MITYINKDISTIQYGIIAHGVNCYGVMDAGVAFTLRRKFPQITLPYQTLCSNYDSSSKSHLLGMVQLIDINKNYPNSLMVANCFTQVGYGTNFIHARVDAIEEAMSGLFSYAHVYDIPVFMPKIGCGLGGLNWEQDVQPIIYQLLQDNEEEFSNIDIFVCEYGK